jgi:hypothetical protein
MVGADRYADKQTAAASLRHRRHDQRVIISCDIE